VLFEAPGRVSATCSDLVRTAGGGRQIAIARELSKMHEEIWCGSLDEAAAWAAAAPLRGEVVLVVSGADETAPSVDDQVLTAALAERLARGERSRGAIDEVAEHFGVPRKRVYALALAARSDQVPGPEQAADA
jgi:16S rRNA (cytidine1402-2'-O)-methyltransferase